MSIDEESLTSAKATCFAAIIASTASTEKKNAFSGHLPPAIKTWAIFFGAGADVANTWNVPITELRMNSEIIGYWKEQTDADQFNMLVLDGLPVKDSGNVYWYRLRRGGVPRSDLRYVAIGNDPKKQPVWVSQVGLETVFDTTTH